MTRENALAYLHLNIFKVFYWRQCVVNEAVPKVAQEGQLSLLVSFVPSVQNTRPLALQILISLLPFEITIPSLHFLLGQPPHSAGIPPCSNFPLASSSSLSSLILAVRALKSPLIIILSSNFFPNRLQIFLYHIFQFPDSIFTSLWIDTDKSQAQPLYLHASMTSSCGK